MKMCFFLLKYFFIVYVDAIITEGDSYQDVFLSGTFIKSKYNQIIYRHRKRTAGTPRIG